MACNEKCCYARVNTIDREVSDVHNVGKKLQWIVFLRQLLVCSAVWLGFFATGLCVGAPTVIIPQIRREANSTDVISQEMASWLSSAIGYSGTVLVLVLSILPKFMGRKIIFLLIMIVALIGFLNLYFAQAVIHLLIGLCFEGILFASQTTMSIMIVTEYTSPRYRGVFLTMKSVSFLWGIWISNTIGTYFHWKNIALLGCVAVMYNIITILRWPDSPYWLANKGRLAECATAHRWLKGTSAESNEELENLINRHTNLKQEIVEENVGNDFRKYYRVIRCKSFYKPLSLSFLILTLYNSLGKITITVYAIDIIKKITGNETTAYSGMLLLDGVTILGMHIGCGISKIAPRRSFLLVTSGLGIMFLYLLALYLFVVGYYDLRENMYVSIILLTSYTVSVSCGPMIMATSLMSELIPLSYRNLFVFLLGTYGSFMFASFIKVGPILFGTCGFSGAFLVYASIALVCSVLLYYFLPETKDKTLIEIENLFVDSESQMDIS